MAGSISFLVPFLCYFFSFGVIQSVIFSHVSEANRRCQVLEWLGNVIGALSYITIFFSPLSVTWKQGIIIMIIIFVSSSLRRTLCQGLKNLFFAVAPAPAFCLSYLSMSVASDRRDGHEATAYIFVLTSTRT